MKRAHMTGLVIGLAAAVALLATASVWLLSMPETSAKVLVAVWLWALPVLGIGALSGWLAGRVAGRLLKTGP